MIAQSELFTFRDERDLGAFIPAQLDDLGLNPYEFRVYCRMARRAGNGICFESLKSMADGCQVSASSIRRAIARLMDYCLIARERPQGTTPQTSDRFRLLPPILWKKPNDAALTDLPGESDRTAPHVPQNSPPVPTEQHKDLTLKVLTSKEIKSKRENQENSLSPELIETVAVEVKPEEVLESATIVDSEIVSYSDNEIETQTNIVPGAALNSSAIQVKSSAADKARSHWEKTGKVPPSPIEFEEWAKVDLGGDVIAKYRKSGRVTTVSRGDINPSFAVYVSHQGKKDIDYGYSYIRKMERDPQSWEVLSALVMKWCVAEETGNARANITQTIKPRMVRPSADVLEYLAEKESRRQAS